jgi:hypothetical protein
MFASVGLLESQERDDPGQAAQSHRLRDVVLKAGSQAGEPVIGRGETRDGRGGDVPSLVGRQLSYFSNQPITVLVGHGNVAEESVRPFSLDDG